MSKLEITGRALAAVGLAGFALFVPVSIAATQIGLGVAAAGLALSWLSGWRPKRSPLDLPLALFIAAALASTLAATLFLREGPGSFQSATLWRHALGFWIAFQALGRARDPRAAARRALLFAALGLVAASLVGLMQYRSGFDVVHALGLRETARLVAAPGVPGRFAAMGFFISRLTFGHNAMILCALFAGAIAFGRFSFRVRAALLFATALGLAAIVLTFDRAAWLGLFAGALALLFMLARSGPREMVGTPTIREPRAHRKHLAIAGAVCALLCLGAALVPGVRARFVSGFDVQQNRDRVFLWSRALEIIRDHPLAGVGFGNYPKVCPRYYDRVDPSFPMRTWAHNSFLSLWAETGPLGMLALLFLLFRIARGLRERLRAGGALTAGALAAGVAILMVAQVHDVVYDSKVMYPLWLALALGLAPALDDASVSQRVQPGKALVPAQEAAAEHHLGLSLEVKPA